MSQEYNCTRVNYIKCASLIKTDRVVAFESLAVFDKTFQRISKSRGGGFLKVYVLF